MSCSFGGSAQSARTPPPPVKGDPQLTERVNSNELARELFAHSSAIHVSVGGKSRFDETVAKKLLMEMQTNQKSIAKYGKFADKQERARVLDVYADGVEELKRRIRER